MVVHAIVVSLVIQVRLITSVFIKGNKILNSGVFFVIFFYKQHNNMFIMLTRDFFLSVYRLTE